MMSSSLSANKRTVIGVDNIKGIAQVLFGFPSGIMGRVTFPFYQVLEASTVEAFVEDGFDFIFGFVLAWDVNRKRWGLDVTGKF